MSEYSRVIIWEYKFSELTSLFSIYDGLTQEVLLHGYKSSKSPLSIEPILKTICDALNKHQVTIGPYEKDIQSHSQALPKSEINPAHEKDSA